MRIKKMLCVALAGCMLLSILSVTAFADVTALRHENTILIVAELGEKYAGKNITVEVFKPGKSVSDLTDNKPETIMAALAYYYHSKADAEGNVTFKFDPDDTVSGRYNVVVGGERITDKPTTTFVFVGAKTLQDYIDALKDIDTEADDAIDKIAEVFEERSDGLSGYSMLMLDNTKAYAVFSDENLCTDSTKTAVYKQILENVATIENSEDFAELFSNAVFFRTLDAITDKSKLKTYVETYEKELGLAELSAYKNIYKNGGLSNNAKLSIMEKMAKLDLSDRETEKIHAEIEDCIMFNAIEAVDIYTQLTGIVDKAIGYFGNKGIDMEQYAKVEDKTELARLLYNSKYSDMKGFVENFNDILDGLVAPEKDEKDEDKGSSGRGSGGSTYRTPFSPTIDLEPLPPSSVEKKGYTDIKEVTWATDAIEYFSDKDIVNGRGSGLFAPNDWMTRAELAKILAMLFDVYDSTLKVDGSLLDISDDDWYGTYVQSVVNAGIMEGYGDFFGANDNITRQDLVTAVYRAALAEGWELPDSGKGSTFDDKDKIADYAKTGIAVFELAKIVQGMDGNLFCPIENTTRAQAVTILYRLLETVGKK